MTETLPSTVDVLVAGAGVAGTATAILLAKGISLYTSPLSTDAAGDEVS
ncbi:hypothetical protein [Verminephrobacter aporrectodeae]|nr:hypothetical protein [Verminephrobacter aporrectodeae]